ncbi:MAG TPA: histidinol-phosphate transaminase [Cytophagaceae bacterium]|jgi:histidinol-phosphate aminotransferase|nr:histidinol-phosphate transaminase [Cytophagaceae bacterium]
MFKLEEILRSNIRNAKPYSSARDEYKGKEGIFLDANENPFGSVGGHKYNRYPDPLQWKLKEKIAPLKKVKPEQVFLGNGSDEPIDLLIRAVCDPGKDAILITPPTYGMYEVSAAINDVKVVAVPLTADYVLDVEAMLPKLTSDVKIVFLCSPNNPTGNLIPEDQIITILKHAKGIVVVDEAYIDFAPEGSLIRILKDYPNLVILQTFSKAWGLAALRLGMAFASEEIIAVLNKIKPPYNINAVTQQLAYEAIGQILKKEQMVAGILMERAYLEAELVKLPVIQKVYPSDANFILVKTANGTAMYTYLINQKIITRDRSNVMLCDNSIRITVGTHEENEALVNALKKYN